MPTKIEWTNETWNPVRGCSKVSAGCDNCYAVRQAARFSAHGAPYHGLVSVFGPPRWTGMVQLVESVLEKPLHWRKPRRVFANSMSDLFHERLSDRAIDAVWEVMARCPQHTFQVLTKRPERAVEWVQRKKLFIELHNVWLGVSVENQTAADERIEELQQFPAALRFVSCEPMLAGVDLTRFLPQLDWVICGCETGPGARPMLEAWARDLRDQCQDAGVPFFLKQLSRYGRLIKRPQLDGRQWTEMPRTCDESA